MPNYNYDILIDNITLLLKNANITQKQLGEEIGMSQPNISKALNKNDKKRFTLEQIIEIANYFNTSIDALFNNSPSSDIKISPRYTAAFLSELILQHKAEFTLITKETEIYTPSFDYLDNHPDYNVEQREVQYPAIYLPSYWNVPYEITDKINQDTLWDIQLEAEQCGNDTIMKPVNDFLFHFKELFEIYDKNGLSEETFNTVLEDMLNRLKDK